MTTSLTSTPTGSSTPPVATQMNGTSSGRRRTGLWALLAVVVFGSVGYGAWAAMNWREAAKSVALVEQYEIQPRSFSVVLKEKGELQPAKSTEIVSEVEGRSTIISLVPEGTAVKKGDLLVELASDQIEDRIRQDELKETNAVTVFEAAQTELEIQRDKNASDIRKADLQIELKQLALDKYKKGDWAQKQKDAHIAIQQAEINLQREEEDYEAAQKLYERNFITKTEFWDDQFNFTKAKWDLEKAKQAKLVLEDYTHIADLRQRESDLEEAKKEFLRVKKNADAEELKKVRSLEGKETELELIREQLAKLRRQKEKSRITAPTQGFVVYYSGGGRRHFMSNDSQIREGATVHERQILMTLPDTSEMQVLVRVHEAKTDKLQLGQPARIKIEGIPDVQFDGSVTKIAVVADTQNRWLNPDLKEYETEITLDPTETPLKPGVTAHVEILVQTVEDEPAVPVQAVYSKAGKRYVFGINRRKVAPVEVQLGAIGAEWAQIAEGVTPGQNILLAFTDEHKRLIPDLPPGTRRGQSWNGNTRKGSSTGSPGAGSAAHQGAMNRRPQGAHGQSSGMSRRPGQGRPGQSYGRDASKRSKKDGASATRPSQGQHGQRPQSPTKGTRKRPTP